MFGYDGVVDCYHATKLQNKKAPLREFVAGQLFLYLRYDIPLNCILRNTNGSKHCSGVNSAIVI